VRVVWCQLQAEVIAKLAQTNFGQLARGPQFSLAQVSVEA